VKYYVTIAGRSFEVAFGTDGVTLDGLPVSARIERADGTPVLGLVVDHRTYRVLAEREGRGSWRLGIDGTVLEADVVDERTRVIREMMGPGAAPAGPRPIVAPMPGMVVKVEVTEGDRVEAGQGVVIVEAMKMENELRASAAGVVSRVRVRAGDAVEKGQVLVDLELTAESTV
jgi:pyruvate carboxylase subunit B